MRTRNIEKLIIKYLNSNASKDELDALTLLLAHEKNKKVFKSYIRTNYGIEYTMKKFNTEESKKKLLEMIHKEQKVIRMRRFQKITTYAAVFLVFLATGYFYWYGGFDKKEQLTIPEENITLTLSDGQVKIINAAEEKEVKDSKGQVLGHQKGKTLAYAKNSEIKELVYNKLTVPYGKRFQLTLSDGSQVYLNAGTSIQYPVKFIEGKDRQVIITGEAYFEVAKDQKHPFIVHAQDLNVRVLGTEFNVAAYPEDTHTNVVLVEGSVGMHDKNKEFRKHTTTVLNPGLMGVFRKGTKQISTQEVNTTIYTSWIKGNVVFRNASFANIATKLERLYNVTIINNNKKIALESFNASINVDKEPIEKVLEYFNKVYKIDYQIVNNKIVIQ
ncbi:FecR family protein [uncultured Polaribacter sp.]|uniref:FecR family protein n=1 Tax=uncultured Polaribacter sp. TaxID=174711 RepID=UPI002636EB96|nr:FecR family protein [uncultured Polaribacter sp.]